MTPWDHFFRESITRIFHEKGTIIDIGGGLRVSRGKGNRYDPSREWARLLAEEKSYKILDPVPDYDPDIVGDIHDLPFESNSQEALICIAVLEHVENPFKAMDEMYRVLKPGGHLFLYVPFLYYYHAETGYYKDYWRFTGDALTKLCDKFSHKEHQSVRGALETWLHISPLGRVPLLPSLARVLDRLLRKVDSKQVSGYYAFLIK